MASDLLAIASSGVRAARSALDVTAQNIANASTTGYVRRSVQLSELASASAFGQTGDLSFSGVRVIGMSLGRDQDHKEILMRRQANERIALFLHGLSERLRAIGRDPVRIRLPMSRIDIANYLGLALETVSRGFTRLQEEGLIDVHGRQVTVLAAATLTRLAHGMAQDEAAAPRRRPAG